MLFTFWIPWNIGDQIRKKKNYQVWQELDSSIRSDAQHVILAAYHDELVIKQLGYTEWLSSCTIIWKEKKEECLWSSTKLHSYLWSIHRNSCLPSFRAL
jgi:hypothetical protein